MRYVVAFVTVAVVASLIQAEIILSDTQKEKLAGHHKACAVDSNADEYLKHLVDGVFVEDQTFKEYLLCVSKRIGFQNDAGEIQKEVVIEHLKKSITDPSKAEEYTETCTAKLGDSPADGVYKVVTCLNRITPEASILAR